MTDVLDPRSVRDSMTKRDFALGLTLIVAIALAIRIGAAFWYDANTHIGGDAIWYTGVAHQLAQGHGFIEPLQAAALGDKVPTAAHPPLYALYLSVVDVAG